MNLIKRIETPKGQPPTAPRPPARSFTPGTLKKSFFPLAVTEGTYAAMLGVFAFLAAAKAAGVSARRWGLPPICRTFGVPGAQPYTLGGALDLRRGRVRA